MAKVSADTDSLRQFAAELARFVNDATALRSKLVAAQRKAGDGWNDPVYQRVNSQIDQAMKNLDGFLRQVEPEVPVIKKKVEDLERYLG